jgi:hypothetical protein
MEGHWNNERPIIMGGAVLKEGVNKIQLQSKMLNVISLKILITNEPRAGNHIGNRHL